MHLNSYNCVLSIALVEESYQHLFQDCHFARMCWDIINIDYSIDNNFPKATSLLKTCYNHNSTWRL
jgi:hypothetical protein